MTSHIPRRFLHTSRVLHHENPLGLPHKGTIPRFQRGLPQKRPIKGVSHIVAVSSAKGGVGKSTVAANLALALARLGLRAGILDTDIFGPSIPTLFDLAGTEPRLTENNQLLPLTNYGVKTMSLGYLHPDESAPVVWRGPMLLKAVQQLLHDVDWAAAGGVDVLVLDLPPGTGDVQLSIAQQVPVDGAVVVTTPHILAVKDAVKGVGMFGKVGVPVLGLVQNMSVFKCPCCGGETKVFGGDERVVQMCEEYGIEMLGDVPLHPNIGEDGSRGKPTVAAEPESDRAGVFMDVARKLAGKIGLEVS
ncbi:P-loop containing nucleoside triphosphate hydrolase protein [Staphylotrichum tortipilum]|uniref:P-loop containing nucleoside triphosphate hydrolase protein n=1 Tax=Staphylotrichum tortipilum TaxID=2831512 RepID=A0AAN6MLP2_9PEZI|nr:P-loop containing nucleoside triphosphate hydrolase protein [Staphylotrichum longicolle]